MNGRYASPRPWTFAETAPPMQRSSAPVCFWRIAQRRARERVDERRPLDAGLDLDETVLLVDRENTSKAAACRARRRLSQNCCPPIAWRPPAIETGRRAERARASAVPIDSSESTGTTASTSVSLSREWTSLTTIRSSNPEVEGDEREEREPRAREGGGEHDDERDLEGATSDVLLGAGGRRRRRRLRYVS